VYEVDPERGFLAMEFIEGEPLSAKIGGRPLRPEEALGLAVQIGEGLKAAHDKGITHRDIKSGNILVTRQGQAKILDFGLAREAGQTALTHEGAVAGTPGYMAPEQASGGVVDQRTDIWALGAVLHEMLTGRLPMGQTEMLPQDLGRVVRKALAADPRERYQHVDDMLVDLHRAGGRRPHGQSRCTTPAMVGGGWSHGGCRGGGRCPVAGAPSSRSREMGAVDAVCRFGRAALAFTVRADGDVRARTLDVQHAGRDLREDAAGRRSRSTYQRWVEQDESGVFSGWRADRLYGGGRRQMG
jgi:hypothetical protein